MAKLHPIYWIRAPVAGPAPPRHWSYSALASWRACPLQWYLTRATYAGVATPGYPQRTSAAAVQGQAMHAALEEMARDRRRVGAGDERPAVSIRATVRRHFEAILERLSSENPRAQIDQIRAQVHLDDCVNLVKRALARLPAISAADSAPAWTGGRGLPSGAEVWIQLDDPRIGGRIDLIADGGILDFKTGAPANHHADQLTFYALLWYLKTGEPPRRLEVSYARPSRTDLLVVPSVAELSASADDLRKEIAEADDVIGRAAPVARPSEHVCAGCGVRQICDAYWSSPETSSLRASRARMAHDEVGETCRADVHIDRLPGDWKPGEAMVGVAGAGDLGDVTLRIGRAFCPEAGAERPTSVRLLGALLTRGVNGWESAATAGTELFWGPPE